MASKAIAVSGAAAVHNPPSTDTLSNGVITNNATLGGAVNRKKQKRRQKQAAERQASSHRSAGNASEPEEDDNVDNYATHAPMVTSPQLGGNPQHNNATTWAASEQQGAMEIEVEYNSDVDDRYNPERWGLPKGTILNYDPNTGARIRRRPKGPMANYDSNTGALLAGRKKAVPKFDLNISAPFHDARKQGNNHGDAEYRDARLYPRSTYSHLPHPMPPRPISEEALRTVQRKVKDPIWDTSTSEERARIKEFWLALGEGERRSLVKIEKEAVLRKMKEQQKHSCSCTVCGRKRTAIEEELEVLYDAYYEELEQFANNNHGQSRYPHLRESSQNGTPMPPPPRAHPVTQTPSRRVPDLHQPRKSSRGRIQELPDDAPAGYAGDEVAEDVEESDTHDEAYDADDPDYSGTEPDLPAPRVRAQDFFTFGNSLTVQAGGILTVADDLLKNDGQKFIDMMEQLAERRMAREDVSQYASYNVTHAPLPSGHSHPGHNHLPPDDEESYDDEADDDYGSDEDDYGEEDDTDTMTEDQRMQEGRRMFQIFAARMFEQRVLTAYREKVARERQEKLIEELEADKLANTERDLKKAKDAEKKKQKKLQQKQTKAEEKAKKDEAKAAEEAGLRLAEEKKQQELKIKREDQRKKKEAERKALEEEKQRKEAEKLRRQQEERERQQDAERKTRELKAEEKKRREEAKKKEREEREAREKERKAADEKQRAEREEKAKAEKGARERSEGVLTQPEAAKRPSQPTLVALPPGLKPTQQSGHGSPQAKVAAPVLVKAPIPARPREIAGRTSHTPSSQMSAPRSPDSGFASKQATPPRSASSQFGPQQLNFPGFRTPGQPQATSHPSQLSPLHVIAPPPGMHLQQHTGPFGGLAPSVLNGFSNGQGPMSSGVINRMPHGQQMPMYSQHAPAQGLLQRTFAHNGPPPGMIPGTLQSQNRPYLPETPTGYPSAPIVSGANSTHLPLSGHSRKMSTPLLVQPHEISTPGAAAQPIARPAPIKRPASAKPTELNGTRSSLSQNMEDMTNHLGSSALLDDSDEPLPVSSTGRRVSGAPRNPSMSLGGSPFDQTSPYSFGGRSTSFDNWGSSSIPFSSSSYNGSSGWGNAQSTGWSNSGGFHASHHRSVNARPVAVRLLATQACRSLSAFKQVQEATFVDVNDLLRQVNTIRQTHEAPVELAELNLILETEGDAHNGGGTFVLRPDVSNKRQVRWEPDAAIPNTRGATMSLGEIGSPLPGTSMPFGAVRGL